MNRFDFLHDGRPDALDAILALRIPLRWRAQVASALAAIAACLACVCVNGVRLHAAQAEVVRAQAQADRYSIELAHAKIAWNQALTLLQDERRLRAVESSGARAVGRLIAVGDAIEPGTWLTQVTPVDDVASSIRGEVVDLKALSRTLAALHQRGAVRLVRVSRVDRMASASRLAFELQIGEP